MMHIISWYVKKDFAISYFLNGFDKIFFVTCKGNSKTLRPWVPVNTQVARQGTVTAAPIKVTKVVTEMRVTCIN